MIMIEGARNWWSILGTQTFFRPQGCLFEGRAPQRRPQRRLDRRLEGVAEAVGGGYCRLRMLSSLALDVRGTVAGHRQGALEEGGGTHPPFQCIPALWYRAGIWGGGRPSGPQTPRIRHPWPSRSSVCGRPGGRCFVDGAYPCQGPSLMKGRYAPPHNGTRGSRPRKAPGHTTTATARYQTLIIITESQGALHGRQSVAVGA